MLLTNFVSRGISVTEAFILSFLAKLICNQIIH